MCHGVSWCVMVCHKTNLLEPVEQVELAALGHEEDGLGRHERVERRRDPPVAPKQLAREDLKRERGAAGGRATACTSSVEGRSRDEVDDD